MKLLKKQLKYDFEMNHSVLKRLSDKELQKTSSYNKMMGLMGHILSAQEIWLERMSNSNSSNPSKIWPDWELSSMIEKMRANHTKLMDMVSKINQVTTYTNSKGERFKSDNEDILQHLIIHGQHHRAQISLLMRQENINPPVTDYILYLRK